MTIDRRVFLGGTLALGVAACTTFERNILEPIKKIKIPPIDRTILSKPDERFRLIEASGGGMLGVEIFNPVTGEAIGHNADRRFGHASSFKLSLAAMVLARGAAGTLDIDRRVRWSESELLSYAPYTRERVAEGATLRELARATQVTSDNTAANVILRELGGPAAMTAFWRSIGDDVSRLDRTETTLNNVPVTEYRDTTTPAAMARTVASLLYGEALPAAERAELRQWMIDTQTGLKRVRAGIRTDKGWVAGDKTGTAFVEGMGSNYVDIGFAEPPPSKEGPRAPITFAAYYRLNEVHEGVDPQTEAVLAKLGDVIRDFSIADDGWPF